MIFNYIKKIRSKSSAEKAVYTFFWSAFFTGIFIFFQFFTPFIDFDSYVTETLVYNTKHREENVSYTQTKSSADLDTKSLIDDIKITYLQVRENMSNIKSISEQPSDLIKDFYGLEKIFYNIAGVDFSVYVADEDNERIKGLSSTKELCVSCAMVFVFPEEKELSFWMKDMNYDLDIVYVNSFGKIVKAYEKVSVKNFPETYKSGIPAKYAIEFNSGMFNNLGLKEGDTITLPNIKAKN